MKTVAGWLAVLALLLQCGGAFAQSSDYEIIDTYKKTHRSLLESIAAARNLKSAPTSRARSAGSRRTTRSTGNCSTTASIRTPSSTRSARCASV